MGLEAGWAQPELGGTGAGARHQLCPCHLPVPREAALGGAPGWEGSCSFAASYRSFQLQREPRGPQKDHSTWMCPSTTAKRRRRSTSQLPWQPRPGYRRAPRTLSARAGGLGSPQTGSQPHCRQVRLPAGKGRAQPCRKPRKLPFPREAAGQYDSKSYFTVAKERHVSRESQRGSAAGSQLQVPGTVCPELPTLPKTLRHLLPLRGPWPTPQH